MLGLRKGYLWQHQSQSVEQAVLPVLPDRNQCVLWIVICNTARKVNDKPPRPIHCVQIFAHLPLARLHQMQSVSRTFRILDEY